jgi:hypothetical protein
MRLTLSQTSQAWPWGAGPDDERTHVGLLQGLESCVDGGLANFNKHRLSRVVPMNYWSATAIIPRHYAGLRQRTITHASES